MGEVEAEVEVEVVTINKEITKTMKLILNVSLYNNYLVSDNKSH